MPKISGIGGRSGGGILLPDLDMARAIGVVRSMSVFLRATPT